MDLGTPEAVAGPAPLALAAALHLVTRRRLRLTAEGDSRLGQLADRYEVGCAAWTGQVAIFVGFYQPPSETGAAAADLQVRVAEALAWGTDRLRLQGAQRCDVVLVALGSLGDGRIDPGATAAAGGAVRVGVLTVTRDGKAAAPVPAPRDILGPGDLRRAAATAAAGSAPTLAAVDLAERQTVAGGLVAPMRSAMRSDPVASIAVIGVLGAVFAVELAARRHFTFDLIDGTVLATGPFYAALGALPNTGPGTGDWWRYVTSALVHDVGGSGGIGILHILGNALGIFLLGRPIEQLFGRLALVVTLLVSAVGGSLFWVACHSVGVAGPGIGYGASGGVFGLIGLTLMLGRVQGKGLPVGIAASLRQYAWTLLLYNGAVLFFVGSALGINNWAHAGGLVSGVLLGLVLAPKTDVGGRERRPWETGLMVAVVAAAAVAIVVGAGHLASELATSTPAPQPIIAL